MARPKLASQTWKKEGGPKDNGEWGEKKGNTCTSGKKAGRSL